MWGRSLLNCLCHQNLQMRCMTRRHQCWGLYHRELIEVGCNEGGDQSTMLSVFDGQVGRRGWDDHEHNVESRDGWSWSAEHHGDKGCSPPQCPAGRAAEPASLRGNEPKLLVGKIKENQNSHKRIMVRGRICEPSTCLQAAWSMTHTSVWRPDHLLLQGRSHNHVFPVNLAADLFLLSGIFFLIYLNSQNISNWKWMVRLSVFQNRTWDNQRRLYESETEGFKREEVWVACLRFIADAFFLTSARSSTPG